MKLPEFLSGLEEIFKDSENRAKEMTLAFLSVETTWGLLANILIIGILPAIGEELLFRGVLIRIFNERSRSYHFGIILSAFIFSAIHGQFYGFVPRFVMGCLFGYLFVWGGSLWYPIVAHFVNNTFAVLTFYYFRGTNLEKFTENPSFSAESLIVILLLGVSSVFLLYRFKKYSSCALDDLRFEKRNAD
jgi:membrane protease YdiL (CAAX protease family)